VLVTGAAGFIGAWVARRLARAGRRLVLVDDLSAGRPERLDWALAGAPPRARTAHEFVLADVTRPGVLAEILERAGEVEAVLHLAARVGVRRVLCDPEACRRENLAGVRELVAACAALPERARPRVYAASTSEVYAEKAGPLREGDPLREACGARSPSNTGRWAYAASKLAGERALDAADLWPAGKGPVHLRFFNITGPGQDADAGMVLPTFVEHALAGEPIPVHGDGRQVRTFAHVDEVARALVCMLARGDVPAGAVNLGGRARTSIDGLAREVARGVQELAGPCVPIVRVDPRRHVGASFEEVRSREPALERAAALGLPLPRLGLRAIVRDTLAAARETTLGTRRTACASPAS